MTSRSVPWRPGFGDVERGNSSYQLEKRAWTGSTTMLERRFEGRDVVAVGVAAHPRVEVLVERTARGGALAEAGRPAFELLRVLGRAVGGGAPDRAVHEVRADLQVDGRRPGPRRAA